VERVVFLTLRGEERVECFWPVPLELPAAVSGGTAEQLRLIADDGYAGPARSQTGSPPLPAALPRRQLAGAPPRRKTTLF
jgi:hypothetical protein